ncbi:MAG: porin [Bacteroidales bacterium]|nr:porin [Bacteroidales bacterium]
MIMDRDLFNFPTFTNAEAIDAGFANAGALTDHFAQNKRFWGFYFQAGKLLFGGRQCYDIHQSEFTQPTRGRSWGDIEVLFRYDFLDLNNGIRNCENEMNFHRALGGRADIGQPGGAAHNFTFGISYWMGNNMRFTVNYQISRTDVFANAGGANGTRRNNVVGRDINGHYTGNPFAVVSENPGVRFNVLQARLEMWF